MCALTVLHVYVVGKINLLFRELRANLNTLWDFPICGRQAFLKIEVFRYEAWEAFPVEEGNTEAL